MSQSAEIDAGLPCPSCGRAGGLCVDCTEDGAFGHQRITPPVGGAR